VKINENPMILDDLGPSTGGMCRHLAEDDQPELEEIEDDPQDDADEKSLKKWNLCQWEIQDPKINGGTFVPYFWAYFLGIYPDI
jgi:hypothetical protein